MEMKPLGVVLRDEGLDRIERHFGGRRNLGQEPAIRSAEAKLAIRLSIELIAVLVDRAMVPATLCRLRFYAALADSAVAASLVSRSSARLTYAA